MSVHYSDGNDEFCSGFHQSIKFPFNWSSYDNPLNDGPTQSTPIPIFCIPPGWIVVAGVFEFPVFPVEYIKPLFNLQS